MAIFHLNMKIIQRSKGKSLMAAAAYRRATVMESLIEKASFDYRNKPDVLYSELVMPLNAPNWAKDLQGLEKGQDPHSASESLWQMVETSEKRKDAQLAREIEFSLPIELSFEQNKKLSVEFIQDQLAGRGMIADFSIHWDKGNPHVHVLLTMRQLTEKGFGLKVRSWNDKTFLTELRREWASYVNFHLKLHHHDMQIDHRSYKEQGIALTPTIHIGKAVCQMQARGKDTDKKREMVFIQQDNLKKITQNPSCLLDKITKSQSTFSYETIGHELGRYINDDDKFHYTPSHLEGMHANEILDQDKPTQELLKESLALTPDSIAKILQNIEYHDSVFSEKTLAKTLSPFTNNHEDFTRALLEIKASPELVYLGAGDDGRDKFTTRRMFELENELQKLAENLMHAKFRKVSKTFIARNLAQYEKDLTEKLSLNEQDGGKQIKLTDEQARAVTHIVSSGRISLLVGRAGTGKSFSLGAARAIWERQGKRVIGIALSGIAADGLTKDAKINSRTIEAFKYAIKENQLVLNKEDVIVMDEAGMTDSVSMHFVLESVKKANAKLVLVGDPNQLQPIGAGASFRALLERIGFAELSQVYRQKEDWQKNATTDFCAGRIADAISAYAKKNCVHLVSGEDESLRALASDWRASFNKTKTAHELLVLAHRNEDVKILNNLIRDNLIKNNDLASGFATQGLNGQVHLAKDLRLLFLKNNYELGVNNGRFGTVTSVNFTESGRVINFEVKLDNSDKTVTIDPEKYKHFDYGYAATVHKSQGMTVDNVFVYAGGNGWNRFLTYVAMTRHRHSAHLYANTENFSNEKALSKMLGRKGVKDSLLDFPLAFTERRGIDNSKLLKRLPQHLSEKLNTLKTLLRERALKTFSPEAYFANKQEALNKHEEAEQKQKLREEGRLIASYMDKQIEIGKSWEALKERLNEMGFEKIPYAPEHFSLIAKTPEYQTLISAQEMRNELAHQITQDWTRYQLSINFYELEFETLKSQAKSYERVQKLNEYALFDNAGRFVHRDKVAFEIMNNIKDFYPHLKSNNISAQKIKAEATLHARRGLLSQMTKADRIAFRSLEKYLHLSKKIGKYFAETYKKPNQTKSFKDIPDYITSETNERDKLAKTILDNVSLQDAALTFYQIGKAKPLFENRFKTNDELEREAQKRWYKLIGAGARHDIKLKVQAYIEAKESDDKPLALKIASSIMEEPKAHHGAILSLDHEKGQVWRNIREDGKLHAYKEHYLTLSPHEKKAFKIVKTYVEAKAQHSATWRFIFENKKEHDASNNPSFETLMPLAKRYTELRNKLASEIHKDLPTFEKALAYFKLNKDDLMPEAYKDQCRENVENYDLYSKNKARLLGAELALKIIEDPKSHYSYIKEKSLMWKDIYRDARIFETKKNYHFLTPDERTLYRLARKYREVSQDVGKLMSKKSKYAHNAFPEKDNIKLNNAFSRRDFLAWKIKNAASLANPNLLLSAWKETLKINPDKILKQADFHQSKLNFLGEWQKARSAVVESVSTLERIQNEDQKDLMAIFNKAEHATQTAIRLSKYYRLQNHLGLKYALSSFNLHPDMLNKQITSLNALKEGFKALMKELSIEPTPKITPPNTLEPTLHDKIKPYKQIDTLKLREDLNVQAEVITEYYLGAPKERKGNAWRYGRGKGSLVVTMRGSKQGYWYDFQTGEGGDMLALIQKSLSAVNFKEVLKEASHFVSGNYDSLSVPLQVKAHKISEAPIQDEELRKRIDHAKQIAKESLPIAGTLAERYLQEHRGINGPYFDKTLRYHPNLRNWVNGKVYPALLILARNKEDDICGVQAIFLNPKTGKKADIGREAKLSRGQIGEGAMVKRGDGSGKIAIAEGPETALSIAEAYPDWTVWTSFSVSNFTKTALKINSPEILICADNDGLDSSTHISVNKAAKNIALQGINVWQALPDKPNDKEKWDFNDALLLEGKEKVKSALDKKVLLERGVTKESALQDIKSALIALAANLPVSSKVHSPKTTYAAKKDEKADAYLEQLNAEFIFASKEALEDKIKERWLAGPEHPDFLLIASKNDAAHLNHKIHDQKKLSGHIKEARDVNLNNGEKIELGIGDIIIFREDAPGYDLKRHQRAIVTGFDKAFGCVLISPTTENKKILREIPVYTPLPHIAYGYVLENEALTAQPEEKIIWLASNEAPTSLLKTLMDNKKTLEEVYCTEEVFNDVKAVKQALKKHQILEVKPLKKIAASHNLLELDARELPRPKLDD